MIKINGIVAGYSLKDSIKLPLNNTKIERCKPHPGQSIAKRDLKGQLKRC